MIEEDTWKRGFITCEQRSGSAEEDGSWTLWFIIAEDGQCHLLICNTCFSCSHLDWRWWDWAKKPKWRAWEAQRGSSYRVLVPNGCWHGQSLVFINSRLLCDFSSRIHVMNDGIMWLLVRCCLCVTYRIVFLYQCAGEQHAEGGLLQRLISVIKERQRRRRI